MNAKSHTVISFILAVILVFTGITMSSTDAIAKTKSVKHTYGGVTFKVPASYKYQKSFNGKSFKIFSHKESPTILTFTIADSVAMPDMDSFDFKKPDSDILKKYIESIQKNNPLEKSGILVSKLLKSFAKNFSKNLQEGNRIKISNVKKVKRSGHDAVLFDVAVGRGVLRIYYRYEIIKNDDDDKIIVASIVSLDGTKSHLKDLGKV